MVKKTDLKSDEIELQYYCNIEKCALWRLRADKFAENLEEAFLFVRLPTSEKAEKKRGDKHPNPVRCTNTRKYQLVI